MLVDADAQTAPPRRVPLGPGGRLRAALLTLTDERGTVVRQSERPWASVTFEGARHRFELAFEGGEAIQAGEHFIAALPDHEFAIPGQLVADAAVCEVDHRLAPQPRMRVTCELLLLKDA